MKRCAACGADAPDRMRFCTKCGSPLEEVAAVAEAASAEAEAAETETVKAAEETADAVETAEVSAAQPVSEAPASGNAHVDDSGEEVDPGKEAFTAGAPGFAGAASDASNSSYDSSDSVSGPAATAGSEAASSDSLSGDTEDKWFKLAEEMETRKGDQGSPKARRVKGWMISVVIAVIVLLAMVIVPQAYMKLSPMTAVPDVVGLTQDEATARLEESHLVVGRVFKEYNDYYDEGCVVEQGVEEGTGAERGDAIDLTVSEGPKPQGTATSTEPKDQPRTEVPDVSGMTPDEATKTLEDLGFSVTVMEAGNYSDTVEKGLVCYQSPSAGAQAIDHSEVRLKLSLGPDSGEKKGSKGSETGSTTPESSVQSTSSGRVTGTDEKTGKSASATVKVYPWVKGSDTEKLNELWEDAGGDGDFPVSAADHIGGIDHAVVLIGTVSYRNETPDYDIEKFRATLKVETKRDWASDEADDFYSTLQTDAAWITYTSNGGTEIETTWQSGTWMMNTLQLPTPLMKGANWGPTPFAIVLGSYTTPRFPDGDPALDGARLRLGMGGTLASYDSEKEENGDTLIETTKGW